MAAAPDTAVPFALVLGVSFSDLAPGVCSTARVSGKTLAMQMRIFMLALIVAYVLAPAIMFFTTVAAFPATGRRRWLYLVPWLPLVGYLAWVVFDLRSGRSSHQLLGFELGVPAFAGLLIFGVLWFGKLLPRRGSSAN